MGTITIVDRDLDRDRRSFENDRRSLENDRVK